MAVTATAALLLACGCALDTDITVTGSVADDTVAVQAPTLPAPIANVTGAAADAGAMGDSSGSSVARSRPATLTALTQLGSVVRIASVEASAGYPVRAGELLATLDRSMLDASIAVATAASRSAAAQVDVISARIDAVSEGLSTIASNRATVSNTIGQLQSTRSQLVSQLATLRAALAKVEAAQAALKRLPKPGTIPTGYPGTVPPGGIPLGGLPDPAALAAQEAQLRSGISRIESALSKLDAGLVKADAGLSTLASAKASAQDVKQQLDGLRRLARIAASASMTAVDLAVYQRSLSEVRSPTDGVLVEIAQAGDVLAPGASVAKVRPGGPTKVRAWLAPAQAARVRVGDPATVSADSVSETLRARVTRLGERALYPPTSSATKETHLTRAVPVELAVVDDAGVYLAPGTPVDITIRPRGTPRP